jgi:hypothetical protein
MSTPAPGDSGHGRDQGETIQTMEKIVRTEIPVDWSQLMVFRRGPHAQPDFGKRKKRPGGRTWPGPRRS